MKRLLSYVAFVVCVLITACGNSSRNNSYENNPFEECSSSESEGGDYAEQEIQMITCPIYNGTGIFDFMPGDVMAPKQITIM